MNSIFSVASLAAYFLASMVSFTPTSQHAYYEPEAVTQARYAAIAEALAEVMLAEPMSDSERLKVGVVMVSIGDAESDWRADVVSCSKGGDHDKSWGPWQTQLPKAQVCEGTRSAARLALGMVKRSFLICKELPTPARLSWYTDGGAWNSSPERKARANRRSSFRMIRALAWVKQHPLNTSEAP
jgi:Tfp pilus assembly protein PilV